MRISRYLSVAGLDFFLPGPDPPPCTSWGWGDRSQTPPPFLPSPLNAGEREKNAQELCVLRSVTPQRLLLDFSWNVYRNTWCVQVNQKSLHKQTNKQKSDQYVFVFFCLWVQLLICALIRGDKTILQHEKVPQRWEQLYKHFTVFLFCFCFLTLCAFILERKQLLYNLWVQIQQHLC